MAHGKLTTASPCSGSTAAFAWRFWTLDWGTPTSGEHTIRSRAYDEDGNVQPTPDDPSSQPPDLLGEQRADHPAGARRLTGRWFERPLP